MLPRHATSLLRSGVPSLHRTSLRRLMDDVTPMSIADRVEQQAVKSGQFDKLRGKGKPLPDEDPESQVHMAQLSKNLEGRAESEMRRAGAMLREISAERKGEALAESHGRDSSMAQASIQQHAQASTRGKR